MAIVNQFVSGRTIEGILAIGNAQKPRYPSPAMESIIQVFMPSSVVIWHPSICCGRNKLCLCPSFVNLVASGKGELILVVTLASSNIDWCAEHRHLSRSTLEASSAADRAEASKEKVGGPAERTLQAGAAGARQPILSRLRFVDTTEPTPANLLVPHDSLWTRHRQPFASLCPPHPRAFGPWTGTGTPLRAFILGLRGVGRNRLSALRPLSRIPPPRKPSFAPPRGTATAGNLEI
ncbi:hypothetical protein NA56DRAFT_706183 [Hyaloscypha hepaticicola]|uniref:Uncharacterized protein n=1 Tax=Hyaloscypha hepaticicola TaxID=2082293 RepID=A0A2J6PYM3_9HELO|nr:hypothetical protein NA56DRAFT_706183 [Hyaloscypha hepaticicola]